MSFVPRLTKPEAGNKYYIRKANGGYSDAIKGNPTDKDCDVLSNCVGYAYGRFNEIGGYGYCKYLCPTNAENFIQYMGKGLTVGQTPKLGACCVWQKGATLSGSDGAGHVAIVEKIISPTQIVTSESGWNSKNPFWTKTRNKGSDGNWGAGSGYKFLGFIYNPAVPDEPSDTKQVDEPKTVSFRKGDLVEIVSDTYYGGQKVPGWVKSQRWYVMRTPTNDRVVVNENEKRTNKICSPFKASSLKLVKAAGGEAGFSKYTVKVNVSALNIRKGAGTNTPVTGCIRDKGGIYTIVAEASGVGANKWGKLLSGAGWIALDYCTKL